jgi:hypothetical protein
MWELLVKLLVNVMVSRLSEAYSGYILGLFLFSNICPKQTAAPINRNPPYFDIMNKYAALLFHVHFVVFAHKYIQPHIITNDLK